MVLLALTACTPAPADFPIQPDEAALFVCPRVDPLVLATGRVFVGVLVENHGVFGADADAESGCATIVLPPGRYSTWVYAEDG
jgi:hypothetical protein